MLIFQSITPINHNREKQVILLIDSKLGKMVLSCSKNLSALLRGITSKNHGGFYCLNCLHSFVTENKCESH